MESRYAERFIDIEQIQREFATSGYVCSESIATTLHLAAHLDKPILIEGPAGVGKTELGKATASSLELPLIRLQCYEGLDEAKALYEWEYSKQLLYVQMLKDKFGALLAETASLNDAV